MLSCVGVAPFISQIAAWPLSFCQMMSDLPSLLKSPVPTVCQLAGGAATTLSKVGWVAFISQIAAWPFAGSAAFAALLYCHRMSALPSPLKSPVASACQLGGGWAMTGPAVGVVPFISQIAVSPLSGSEALAVLLYCQRISASPSPLKSPDVIACQPGGGAAMIGPVIGAVPFISQTAVWPFCGSAGLPA